MTKIIDHLPLSDTESGIANLNKRNPVCRRKNLESVLKAVFVLGIATGLALAGVVWICCR